MASLATFIGTPDWRSALLAAVYALPWLWLLSRRGLREPWLWAAVAVGAVAFAPTIAWIQVPLQQAISVLWVQLIGMEAIQRYLLLVGIPSLVVASVVQEGAKLLVAMGGLQLLRRPRDPRAALALGAAAGAGYGGFEAFWVFNSILGSGWSWAAVQLGGPQALLGFVERLYTVPFHACSAALAAYGFGTGRPWRFLLLAVALHTAVNYSAVAYQAGILNIWTVELLGALVTAGTITTALWLRRRTPEAAAGAV